MPPKPNARNWNDVQTAIATAAIVTTLGMWNFFAVPAKAEKTESMPTEEKVPPKPAVPALPFTDAPVGFPLEVQPAAMPYVKVFFTPMAPETTTVVQQPQQQEKKKKKKKKNNNNGGGGGGATASVAQTSSS